MHATTGTVEIIRNGLFTNFSLLGNISIIFKLPYSLLYSVTHPGQPHIRTTIDSYPFPNSHLCLVSLPPFKDMLPHSKCHSTYGFFPSSCPNSPPTFVSSLNGCHCTLADPRLASIRTFLIGTPVEGIPFTSQN